MLIPVRGRAGARGCRGRDDAVAGEQHQAAEQHHAECGQRGEGDIHLVAQINGGAEINQHGAVHDALGVDAFEH